MAGRLADPPPAAGPFGTDRLAPRRRRRRCRTARAFLDDPEHAAADCLVLDVRMPGMSGLELQSRLDGGDWLAPIIFISGHADVPIAVQAMRALAAERGAIEARFKK
ncbi:MAG: response regulator [Betaproteobacteria bacterium]|nr:response regulator [Betaproteobacteria bacterium]